MPKRIDLTGQRFNRLVAIEQVSHRTGRIYWQFLCDCGNTCETRVNAVRSGKTKSCGCYHRDVSAQTSYSKFVTHGMTYTHEYETWCRIKQRCHNPNNPDYKYYGGRGIVMCDLWRNSFETFYAYIRTNLGERPPGKTIDRINNNSNYEPANVRWATRKEQSNNQRPRRKQPPSAWFDMFDRV